MRVQFDIPESEAAESVKLFMMKNKRLRVTVECVPNGPTWEEPYADLIPDTEEIEIEDVSKTTRRRKTTKRA